MRRVHRLGCVVLVSVAVAACGGSGEDGALFGPGTPSAGAGGGSAGKSSGGGAGKSSGGSSGGGAAGKSSGGSSGGGAGGNGQSGSAGATGGKAQGGAAGKAQGGAAGTAGKAQGGAPGAGQGGSAGAGGGAAGDGGSAGSGAGGGAAGDGGSAGSGAGGGSAGSGAGGGSAGSGAGGGSAGSGAGGGSAGSGAGGGSAGSGGAPACVGDKTACTTASGAHGLCVGGSCEDCVAPGDDQACRAAYATADLCAAGSCEACDAPGATLFVDPANGNDARGSGGVTAGGAPAAGCALRTITAAIKLIASGTSAATTIHVLGPATLDATESYPLVIPANVTVTTTGDVLAKPTSLSGNTASLVRLVHPGSAIDTDATFTLDGSALNVGSQAAGVIADVGSTDTTHLRGVTITKLPGNGIRLSGKARLTLRDGVSVVDAGRGNTLSGIFLTDGGSLLTIDVPSGARPTSVEGATSSGITITGPSGAKLSGAAGSVTPGSVPCSGTVMLSGNAGNGLNLLGSGQVTVDGLVTCDNGGSGGGGDGMFISMNVKAKVRRSVSLNNVRSGIHVDGVGAPSISAGNQVDLGTAADSGGNVVQDPSAHNGGVGICFTPPTTYTMGTLPAVGNTFGPSKDCATTAVKLTTDSSCGQSRDVSVVSASPSVTMDVSMCTIP